MQHLKIEELVEFSTDKRIRKKLFSSQKFAAELLCYEPGQSTPIHHHPSQDEVFYVIQGSGTITLDEEELLVSPNSLVFVPAQTRHGIVVGSESHLVMVFIKAPGSVSPRER